jgi:uncharacterized protein (TIGR02444 family)
VTVSPFWTFSLAVYGAEGVQDECLDLQKRFGLDVNLLLLCAFLGAVHGVRLNADDIAAVRGEVGSWHGEIVKPLRAVRRRLKAPAATDTAAAQLRVQIKADELESERIEQTMLERWADAHLAAWPRGEKSEAVATNIKALLASYGAGPEYLATTKRLIAAALDRARR